MSLFCINEELLIFCCAAMNFIRRIFEDGDPQRVPRDESKQQTMTQMVAAKQCTIEKLRQDIERVVSSTLFSYLKDR